MAKSWRDYASPAPAVCANGAKSPESSPTGRNGTNGTALPPALAAGLVRLSGMAVPSGCDPERWVVARNDAARLVSDGWAALALRLGWSALDLFGAAWGEADGEADGLAVWLDGRTLRALSDDFAVVVSEGGGRSYFNRPREPGACLLWDVTPSNVLPIRREVG